LYSTLLLCAVTSQAQRSGQDLYMTKCQACHGPDGAGATPMGKKLGAHDFRSPEVQAMSDAQFIEVIRSGRNKMPAYGGRLTADQISELLTFLRPAPPPPTAPVPTQVETEKPPRPPPPRLALSLQPANVQVYVDDVFKGMTSAEGRLVIEGLAPGSHRVRMNLIGYTESARAVELKAGETATIEGKLEPAGPKPLELGEIEEALGNGLPPKGITKLVNQYGVDFTLTKPIEQRLRDKGADSDLLVAIATNKK